MTRPLRATFDLSALRHNYTVARESAGTAHCWAVVKANAYGHGLLRCARALAHEPAADGFALVELEGAIALREAGIRQPILLLEGFYQADELPLFAEYRLTPVLHSRAQIQALIDARLPVRLPVYLKLNTGMNRLGLEVDELAGALNALKSSNQTAGITLMSHFSDADAEGSDEEQEAIAGQMSRLARFVTASSPSSPDSVSTLSLANSAALLRYPQARADWARPGIMLYGASPYPQRKTAMALGLRPVMTLGSELIAVRTLAAGERVGYNGQFVADRPMRIGVVACGYADGYPRHAPTGTPVLVTGQRTRTLGRVSMDKLCVDLSELPQAAVGSPVTLWGEGLPADEVAQAAQTISYELFCALGNRVAVVEKN